MGGLYNSLVGALGLFLMIAVCSAIYHPGCKQTTTRSFVVDFGTHSFVKDGCPFHYISGSIHYSRVPRFYWKDRLQKMAAAGLDAIQVYIPWNVHEKVPGVYDFSGEYDLIAFLQMAQQEGLLVILRPGPYICAEWDFGGFPAWLIQKNNSIVLRTMDPAYIAPVDRWLGVLLPKLKPMLYSEGGPVIMIQVENEYGSYFACDHQYLDHLQKVFRTHLGDNIVLFTTDGNGLGYLKCGTHPALLTTVDFGPSGNVTKSFADLKTFQPDGPMVNSEFYTGWLDYWGFPHAGGATSAIVSSLKQMLDMKASVNMYMFEGGTNFGFTNGADPPFHVCPTSYDYDGPLTEAGDITPKYLAIRALIMKYKNVTRPVPSNTTKAAYGTVSMKRLGGILDVVKKTKLETMQSVYPQTMEHIGQSGGFMLYRTVITRNYAGDTLDGDAVRDRAHVFVDGNLRGLIDRNVQTSLALTAAKGQILELFVENQGHINYGSQINNGSKGISGNLTLGGDVLTDWTMVPINLSSVVQKLSSNLFKERRTLPSQGTVGPAMYMGAFKLPQTDKAPADTFLNVSGWFKGQAMVNGFNLGRYWPVRGPQITLYVPASVLKPFPAYNILILLEVDHAPCETMNGIKRRFSANNLMKTSYHDEDCSISFVDVPLINGPYHPFKSNQAANSTEVHRNESTHWRSGF